MAIGLISDECIGSNTDTVTAAGKRKRFESFVDAELDELHLNALSTNLVNEPELSEALYKCIALKSTTPNICETTKLACHQTVLPTEMNPETDGWNHLLRIVVISIICVLISSPIVYLAEYLLGIRCLVPNNYLVWEATRPISDCSYCKGVNQPLILPNMTQEQFEVLSFNMQSIISTSLSIICDSFQPFAYSPQPIIIKNASEHWPAKHRLSFEYLRQLYLNDPLALDTFDEECQFLQFQSNFASLRQLFDSVHVSDEINASTSQSSWYVGFSNCQTSILDALRELYPRPHFLPTDAEIPNTDYIFLGYDQGAVMHVSFINHKRVRHLLTFRAFSARLYTKTHVASTIAGK